MNNKFDYNLIKTLVLIFETKSMSKAAQALGVSAPTLTYSINKLRSYYSDPLFIKSTRGLKPTPLANKLYPAFKKIDEDISQSVMISQDTSPGLYNINVRTNTLMESFLLDRLVNHHQLPAGLCLNFDSQTMQEEDRITALVSREVDIDIGTAIRTNNSLFSVRIAQSRIVALCRKDHPGIGADLSFEQWMREEHAALKSAELNSYLPEKLYSNAYQRNIRYRSQSLLNVLSCIEKTDYIMFLPELLLKYTLRLFNVRAVYIPWMEKDTIDVHAYIHSKAKNDEKLLQIIELVKP